MKAGLQGGEGLVQPHREAAHGAQGPSSSGDQVNTGITAAAFPLGKTQIAAKPDQRGGGAIFSGERECVRPELRYS